MNTVTGPPTCGSTPREFTNRYSRTGLSKAEPLLIRSNCSPPGWRGPLVQGAPTVGGWKQKPRPGRTPSGVNVRVGAGVDTTVMVSVASGAAVAVVLATPAAVGVAVVANVAVSAGVRLAVAAADVRALVAVAVLAAAVEVAVLVAVWAST